MRTRTVPNCCVRHSATPVSPGCSVGETSAQLVVANGICESSIRTTYANIGTKRERRAHRETPPSEPSLGGDAPLPREHRPVWHGRTGKPVWPRPASEGQAGPIALRILESRINSELAGCWIEIDHEESIPL